MLVGATWPFVLRSRGTVGTWRRRSTLLIVAIPAWIVMRVGAEWIYANEFGSSSANNPTWVGIGFVVADAGLLVLLVTSGFAFWWNRAGTQLAGRLVGGLTGLYLVLLAVAWLAMSGKWS